MACFLNCERIVYVKWILSRACARSVHVMGVGVGVGVKITKYFLGWPVEV